MEIGISIYANINKRVVFFEENYTINNVTNNIGGGLKGGDIMKKGLVITIVTLASIALTVGIVKAATEHNITSTLGGVSGDYFDVDGTLMVDSLKVGAQDSGGVTFFNGTILNNTTGTGGADNPVTFGDNVRIDGRVYRGATAGAGLSDNMPFIINDDLQVVGDITYNNSSSGLSAVTITGAIDELKTKSDDDVDRLEFETSFDSSMTGDITVTVGSVVKHYKVFDIPGMTVDERPPQVLWYTPATTSQISTNGWPNVSGLRYVPGVGYPVISDGEIYVNFKNVDSGVTTMLLDGQYHLKVMY